MAGRRLSSSKARVKVVVGLRVYFPEARARVRSDRRESKLPIGGGDARIAHGRWSRCSRSHSCLDRRRGCDGRCCCKCVAVALWTDRTRRRAESMLAAERRDSELIVAAVEYFQGSQRRSVGIAALAVLRERPAWTEYRATVSQPFYRQLLYLIGHADNRWQAHEIANIEGMTDWLLEGDMSLTSDMSRRLHESMPAIRLSGKRTLRKGATRRRSRGRHPSIKTNREMAKVARFVIRCPFD
jgi:hypothetical protein